jgi:hypothetical protein
MATKKGSAMYCAKRNYFLISIALFLFLLSLPLYGMDHQEHQSKSAGEGGVGQMLVYASMPDPGQKVAIGSGCYLLYGFDKKPKLGTVIMKVEIFDGTGKKDTSFEVKADAGMPSMKGAHETGERSFRISKKGVYLLPVNIVMPGDWEIRLTVIKSGKVFFRGRYNFDV